MHLLDSLTGTQHMTSFPPHAGKLALVMHLLHKLRGILCSIARWLSLDGMCRPYRAACGHKLLSLPIYDNI